MNNIFPIFFLAIIAWQCQYPLDDIDQPKKQKFLVVTADLSESYGRILLEYSSEEVEGENINLNTQPLIGIAYVVDGSGNSSYFNTNGEKNTTFHGMAGEAYQLFIEVEGKQYESTIETMPKPPSLDTVDYVFNTKSFLFSTDPLHHGFDVTAHFQDLPEDGNYYQWVWAHYERRRFCGYIADGNVNYGLPCAGDCFSINYNPDLILLSDALVNGQYLDVPILRVSYAAPPLKYYLQVAQRAITKNAYDYFRAVAQQTQNNGNQFDIPSQTLFSTNIHCTSHPNDKVLGIFNLFNSNKKILIIDQAVEYPNATRLTIYPDIQPYDPADPLVSVPSIPCGPESRYNTSIVPEGWVD